MGVRLRSALAFVLLVGCSSSSSGDDTHACELAGTWSLTATRDQSDPGDCPAAAEANEVKEVDTITRTGEIVTIEYDGMSGSCSATVPACKLSLKCDATNASGSLITRQDSWTFSGDSLTGYTTLSVPTETGRCTWNAKVTGTRR
jgi:hypothetical protein